MREFGCSALRVLLFAFSCDVVAAQSSEAAEVTLLEDGFAGLRTGAIGSVLGARAEYHYLAETGPKGVWSISTFVSSPAWQRAWKVAAHEGRPVMLQTYQNKMAHTHPMLCAGDEYWSDYTLSAQFAPLSEKGQSGIIFRYRNDRCYYFFGVDGPRAVLKMVRHESELHKPLEKILASQPFSWKPGADLTARIVLRGKAITAKLNEDLTLTAEDSTYPEGKIAITSDGPTRFVSVRVSASAAERDRVEKRRAAHDQEEKNLQASNPKMVLHRKIKTEGFGVGRNVRFGDLNGDGKTDVLIGQVIHHGPKDTNSELSCLTAMTLDGEMLWQIGEPDQWKDYLTNDVAFQINDLDGDGRNEVVYCRNFEIIVADGATGKTKYKAPTPETPPNTKPPFNKYPRILGDSLMFADLRGIGRASDLILKNRYQTVWALNDKLEIMWKLQCNTGHYPFPFDVDGDGKVEIAIGYSLVDHTGKVLWTLDDKVTDHADGIAIARVGASADAEPRVVCVASDEGVFWADIRGKILKHEYLGHLQNLTVAELRPDLPGLEAMCISFWGNQGNIYFFDAAMNMYHDFEPFQHGSMCLPINWTGKPGEFIVTSPNVEDGGMIDGQGRRVVRFPADAHPEMCYDVLDITGDCRDEIVVWDPYELWVYTQDDSPKEGRLFKPKRNGRHSVSNYQATVSLPGWSDDAKPAGRDRVSSR